MKLPPEILIAPAATIRDAVERIGASGCQIALVVDDERHLLGTVTDGDVRRGLLRRVSLEEDVGQVMKASPVVAPVGTDLETCRRVMREKQIRYLPIVEPNGRVVGIESLVELLDAPAWSNWVVIMAGGRGRRLGSLTDEMPKPLLPVGGRPILETIVGNFRRQGFEHLFLSVNYKRTRIREHFGDGGGRGVRIRYLVENAPLGTAGSLSLLPDRPTEPFIVMNGDVLTSMNFQHLLAYHVDQGAVATMCVREFELQVPYGVAELEGTRLLGLSEKPVHKFFVNAGIYMLSPEALDLVPSEESFDMTRLFEQLLERGDDVAVFPLNEYWVDVGRLNDLLQAQQDFDAIFGLL